MRYLEKIVRGNGWEKRQIKRTEKAALYSVHRPGSEIVLFYEVIKPIKKEGLEYRDLPKTEGKETYPPMECALISLWKYFILEEAEEKYMQLTGQRKNK